MRYFLRGLWIILTSPYWIIREIGDLRSAHEKLIGKIDYASLKPMSLWKWSEYVRANDLTRGMANPHYDLVLKKWVYVPVEEPKT